MKFTHEWLCEYCPVDLAPEALAERMTRIGVKVEELHGSGKDAVYELEITANRPDCLAILGVAREVALLTGTPVRIPPIDVPAQRVERIPDVPVDVEDGTLCPRYTARIVQGVRVAPSPPWLARRLEAIGLRPVNNVVDVTNYVLYETGQPLHAFDLDRLNGRRILVRRARAGEAMTAIDGRDYKLTPDNLVIADAKGPVAIAGVMGGKTTEVGEGTRAILIESAIFDPGSVRRTARRLALHSDSSYRFERGIDPAGVDRASRRAADLIRQLAGGEVLPGYVDLWARGYTPANVRLRYERVQRLLGYPIPREEVRRILVGLDLSVVRETAEEILLSVPSHRPDLEVEADLIEEVARVYGYDRIPETPSLRITLVERHRQGEVEDAIRDYLCGAGYQEVLTPSFDSDERDIRRQGSAFMPPSSQPRLGLLNPEGKADRWLRNSLLPGLLDVQRTNEGYGGTDIRAFEIARVYSRDAADGPVKEETHLGLLDSRGLRHAKGTWEGLLLRLRIDGYMVPKIRDGFRATRSICLRIKDSTTSVMLGEVATDVVARYGLHTAPAVLEADLAPLVAAARIEAPFVSYSTHPSIERDLAIVVPRYLTWNQIAAAMLDAKPSNLESLRPFDPYRGKEVPDDKKWITFRMTFRAMERTLTGAEVDAEVKKVEAAMNALGASLRA